jgi:transcriptional regulator with PAS, ATPase and Fis domain
MFEGAWFEELPVAVTVCDTKGIILWMNDKAGKVFEKDGGKGLIGKNVLDCHPGSAREKLKVLLESQSLNYYTIEKNGIKKLIYQMPWYRGGEYMGMVEFNLDVTEEIPNFIRK